MVKVEITLEGLCEGDYCPDEIMNYINKLKGEIEKWQIATNYYQKNWLETMEDLKEREGISKKEKELGWLNQENV